MIRNILIKTNKNIGELINKSMIDNVDVRRVNQFELESLKIGEYMTITYLDINNQQQSKFNLITTTFINSFYKNLNQQSICTT